MKSEEEFFEQQFFSYFFMSDDEGDIYLEIIKNCKDICDTNNKVNGISKCEIVEMTLKKDNDLIEFNGSLIIGNETRFVKGNIYLDKNMIVVDTYVERLLQQNERRAYTTLDKFISKNGGVIRKSSYNYENIEVTENVDNQSIGGVLK